MPNARTSFPGLLIRPWFIVTLACLLYSLMVISLNDGDPLALVTLGTRFSQNISQEAGGTEGYDGQFVYYIARDPSTAARYISNGDDVPAYRFQRILLPALAMGLSLRQESLLPWVLLAINLISLGAGTALLEYLLRQHNVSRWYALGYGFALGTFGAARLSLPEPLCYALVLAGIVLARQEKWLLSAGLFALAALAKETALIFVAAYGFYLLLQRRWQTMFLFGFIAAAPFILWQLILRWKLGEFGVGSGGAMATGFEIIPFGGILRILTGAGITYQASALPFGNLAFIPTHTVKMPGLLAVFVIFLLMLTPFVIFPTIWGLRETWKAFRSKAFTPTVSLLFANAAIMLFVPFSTYREPLGILRFVVGLQIAIVLYAAERRSRRALLNSTIYGYTVLLMLSWDLSGQ